MPASRSRWGRLAVLGVLAACTAATCATRVVARFEAVRLEVVVAPEPSRSGALDIALPDPSRLVGHPIVFVLRFENAGATAIPVTIAVNDFTIRRVVLAPGRSRVDLSLPATSGAALASPGQATQRLRVRGAPGDWSLQFLEVGNVHASWPGPFGFVVVPAAARQEAPPTPAPALLLFAVLLALSIPPGGPGERKVIRIVEAAGGGALLCLFLALLALPHVSRFAVLLSPPAFWLCVIALHVPAVRRTYGLSRRMLPRVARAPAAWIAALPGRTVRWLSAGGTRRVTILRRTCAVFGLTALAVAQPTFDVVSRSPEFFVARNTALGDVMALSAAICLVLPAGIAGVGLALEWVGARVATLVHGAVVALLTALMVLPWLARDASLDATGAIPLALALGTAAAIGAARFAIVGTFLAALAPAALVVPAAFLLDPDVRGALVPAGATSATADIERTPPIVFIVFDEFPVSSLLDERREIDADRYPGFAGLAADASWFRHANAVSSDTVWAVPAIVSGRYPVTPRAVPTLRYYPNNLFTLLAPAYEMTVFGRFLQLCPPSRCAYDLDAPPDTLPALLSDLSLVWLHVVLPEQLAERLPPIVGDWRGFANARRWRTTDGVRTRNGRREEFHRFLASIDERPARLYFLHSLLPHMPFEYVPSGLAYDAPDYQARSERGARLFERASEAYADALHQRHLLQVGFVDALIGRLIRQLRAIGIYDAALIVVTADHGASYRAGVARRLLSARNQPDIMRVPLFVKLPGQRGGTVIDRDVEVVDILPTIARELGIDLPFDVDGRSLLAGDAPERPYRTFIRRSLTRVAPLRVSGPAGADHWGLDARLRRFGSHDQERLYSVEGTAGLLGRPAAPLLASRPTDVRIALDGERRFADVDPSSEPLPLHVRGDVDAPAPAALQLAIALNGVVAATTVPYQENGRWVFGIVVPERYLKAGRNTVSVYAIERRDGELALLPTGVASS